jgi:hypothetical protein
MAGPKNLPGAPQDRSLTVSATRRSWKSGCLLRNLWLNRSFSGEEIFFATLTPGHHTAPGFGLNAAGVHSGRHHDPDGNLGRGVAVVAVKGSE